MYVVLLAGLLLTVEGCSDYLHNKKCLPADAQGYQFCHHHAEWNTEAVCNGSCNKAGG